MQREYNEKRPSKLDRLSRRVLPLELGCSRTLRVIFNVSFANYNGLNFSQNQPRSEATSPPLSKGDLGGM